MKKIEVLIVDDHHVVLEGTQILLEAYGKKNNIEFIINRSTNLSEANLKLKKSIKLYFIDLQLPPDKHNNLLTGDDLALKAKMKYPNSIIVINTMFDDSVRLNNIVKEINPEALINKADMSKDEFQIMLDNILKGDNYYSKTVNRKVNSIIEQDFKLKKVDRDLLYHIAKGVKTKDLPQLLMISIATVERKKKKLSELFGGDGSDDGLLRKIAEDMGIV